MKNKLLHYYHLKIPGFTLPLTLLICLIILTVSVGISALLSKEIYFSRLSRQSQVAYYAADDGLMCALMIDDHYLDPATGIGIFQYNNLVTAQSVLDKINTQRQTQGLQPLALTDIKCATAAVFDTTASNYALTSFSRVTGSGVTETGETTSFTMHMDLGDGTTRCANVQINKTLTYRQIISRGFATCVNAGQLPVERAVVNTSESGN